MTAESGEVLRRAHQGAAPAGGGSACLWYGSAGRAPRPCGDGRVPGLGSPPGPQRGVLGAVAPSPAVEPPPPSHGYAPSSNRTAARAAGVHRGSTGAPAGGRGVRGDGPQAALEGAFPRRPLWQWRWERRRRRRTVPVRTNRRNTVTSGCGSRWRRPRAPRSSRRTARAGSVHGWGPLVCGARWTGPHRGRCRRRVRPPGCVRGGRSDRAHRRGRVRGPLRVSKVDTQVIDCSGQTARFAGVESGTLRWYMGVLGATAYS